MRVEVYREPVRVNIRSLTAAGERALSEFYRIALAARAPEMQYFLTVADMQGLTYTQGVDVLDYTENTAVLSLYLDIPDDTKGVYYKLSVEPKIKYES